MQNHRIIVAATGASGAVYTRLLLTLFAEAADVEHVALISSPTADAVRAAEGERLPDSPKIVCYAADDMFAPAASGSARYDAMAIVPASMGTIGRIASGVSLSLTERAADVMLKERRRLVVVPREMPYSLVHLRNMTSLTEAGAVVLPASPSFYSLPQTLEEACHTVVERVAVQCGIDVPHFEWGK